MFRARSASRPTSRRFNSAGVEKVSPVASFPAESIGAPALFFSRQRPMASKFSRPKPIGSNTRWQLAQTGSVVWSSVLCRMVNPSTLCSSCSSSSGISGGGGGMRSPRICSSTHTPRRTGLVRLGNDVAASVADIPRIPPRLGFSSLTRRISGPFTNEPRPYNSESDSFRKV